MILQALNQYYLRLESDSGVDVAPFGYSLWFRSTMQRTKASDESRALMHP